MPTFFALREQESIGHGAADDQRIHFIEQVAQQVELGGNLGAADDRCQRPFRLLERPGECLKLGLHGAPCISRQFVAKALGGSVSAVCGRKGVIDPDVAELGERGDERRVVLLFAGVEAGVLKAEDVAGLHRGDRTLRHFADAVVGKFHRPLDDTSNFGGDGLQRLLWIAPLRPAEMRKQNDFAALVGDFSDRGAARSMRVESVTTPFSTGTLRSTRTRTRLPFTST